MGRVGALRRPDAGARGACQSRRLKLIVAYDGAPFAGWQSQSHRNTVQDHLERAFERVTGEAVRVHGGGTKVCAGVHAFAQCAHVDVLKFLPADRWIKALNTQLPRAIRVLRCRYVSNDFHARLSAKGKIYRYRIWTTPILPPFELTVAYALGAGVVLLSIAFGGRSGMSISWLRARAPVVRQVLGGVIAGWPCS